MRRFFLGLLAVLLSLGVASCGGGGGYDGETGPNNSLRMSPLLSDVGLSVGYIAKVARITQGVEPYYVTSSDPSVSAQVLEDGTLVVRGNSPGTSTVAVQDSSVNQKAISLKVEVTTKALSTSLGTSVALESGESRTFTVSGGMAPYTVTSNNNSIVGVTSQVGGVVTIIGRSSGTAVLRVTDDIGATLELTVTVYAPPPPPAFSVSPGTATGQVGTEMVFTILGGVGPYSAVSSAPSVATVQVVGDLARAQLLTQGSSTLTFRDSKGQNFVVTLTSTQTLPPLTISPTSGSGLVGSNLVFTAIGGAGPFTAVSSNPSVATVSVNGASINVSLRAAGSSTITVQDSKGQMVAASVTATAQSVAPLSVNPPSGSGQVGSSMVLLVNGGRAPYTAVSSNPSVVSATVSGNQVAVRFNAAGTGSITIVDTAGAAVSVSMTSTLNVPTLRVNPPSATAQVDTTMDLSITGGAAPYTAASANPSIASVDNLAGNTIRIRFNAVGTTSMTVLDSGGQAVTVGLTTNINATPLTSSPTTATDITGNLVVFTVSGGTAPYTAVSSNPQLSTPSVNGSTVTVNLVQVGSSIITIRDANGQTISVTANATAGGGSGALAFGTDPQNRAVAQADSSPLTYNITNGSGGPYLAYVAASDAGIAEATVAGSVLTIGVGTQGNRCIGTGTRIVQVILLDSNTGATAPVTVTIVGGTEPCPIP